MLRGGESSGPKAGSEAGPTRTKLKKVTLMFASWNQMAGWLRRIDGLRAVA